ncbi:MAG: ABC transporter ATP-binding protein [Alphaproteobacteria bacterium]|nr:ABC transporter ATP-binding protein [Alphaproteobacteria bacterium]MCB9690648.1 ABC transporter ATP-binding protein [Alphaproteobacteria bacterium]
MIRIQNATRRYGGVLAVDGVTVSIEKGEVVGLLGHNGAGKTTLMKMLTGVLEPTAGELMVAGKSITEARTDAQRHVGYLPESAPLYPEMPVYEYLMLMAELRGVPSAQQEAAVLGAAEATGLDGRLAQPIRELSKGYRQRVGIAQAIVHDPDVLILDEPTNGLDPVQIESIRTLVKRLAERTTIVLSTHILQEVEAVCDRVLILIGGRLVADSALADLLRTDRILISAKGDGIAATLAALPGISAVSALGEDARNPGYSRFSATAADPSPAMVGAVLDLAGRNGWSVASIGQEERTLETVFKELQQAHAKGVA